MNDSIDNYVKTLRASLLTGGQILLKGFKSFRKVSYKAPVSPVTEVDLKSQRAILKLIRKRFPRHKFLAEESAIIPTRLIKRYKGPGVRWIIDPLDDPGRSSGRPDRIDASIRSRR